jgi:hypothetical protein
VLYILDKESTGNFLFKLKKNEMFEMLKQVLGVKVMSRARILYDVNGFPNEGTQPKLTADLDVRQIQNRIKHRKDENTGAE